MLKQYAKICLLATVLISQGATAQTKLSSKSKKAIRFYTESDNYFVRKQYEKAVELLHKSILADRKFEEAYLRLGLAHMEMDAYKEAVSVMLAGAQWASPLRKTEYYYYLAKSYLKEGEYGNAKIYADNFLSVAKTTNKRTEEVKLWKTQIDFSLANQDKSYAYRLASLNDSVNVFPTQYFPTLTANDNELIFTVRYGRETNDDEDLYYSVRDKNQQWTKIKPLSVFNTKDREGASSVSADGRRFVFTRCGLSGCDLYESEKKGDAWTPPKSLGPIVNSKGWEAQPALSADGRELYFVSNRKGGYGGYDIWHTKKDNNGRWSNPVNAGANINTPYDELAPFYHANARNLYFASNGLSGFGGYDIYVSEKTDNQWGTPTNMGHPLNDNNDQYSFVVTRDGKMAYFSREKGRNIAKLYQTVIPDEFLIKEKSGLISGGVFDKKTRQPLRAELQLVDLHNQQFHTTVYSDSVSGNFIIATPGQATYMLQVNSPGYLFSSQSIDATAGVSEKIQLDIALEKLEDHPKTVLHNVFFGYDDYRLDQRSKIELERVHIFLQSNPSLRIEISGHTDNVGNEIYNQKLSLQRAEAVRAYLVELGTPKSLIDIKGEGSQRPIAPNDTEEGRQLNRRIEFRVF